MEENKQKIKIMIIDDHPIVRTGIRKIIEMQQDLYVYREAENSGEALEIISSEIPDLVIVDISLDTGMNGIELIKAILEYNKKIICLVLSMHEEAIFIERALKAGAKGYVTKKDASVAIITAIRTVLDGELYLSTSISGKLINKLITVGTDSDLLIDKLSDREIEVFELIGNGQSTGQIADKLNLSPNTIESHRRNIKEKLGIKTGADLVKEAVQWVLEKNS